MRLRFVSTFLMGTAKRMALQTTYQFLEPRAASNYRQLFVRGRSLRADVSLSRQNARVAAQVALALAM